MGAGVVIDDYLGRRNRRRFAQVELLVHESRLVPFGYYGWGTCLGQWQRKGEVRFRREARN
jgi:hypothetical protein